MPTAQSWSRIRIRIVPSLRAPNLGLRLLEKRHRSVKLLDHRIGFPSFQRAGLSGRCLAWIRKKKKQCVLADAGVQLLDVSIFAAAAVFVDDDVVVVGRIPLTLSLLLRWIHVLA